MSKSKSIQHLKDLEVKYRSIRTPSIPIRYIKPTKYVDTTSNGLTKCIIDWLRLNNWQAERISNTGRVIKSTKQTNSALGLVSYPRFKYIPGSGTNGTADISATIQGLSVKIEVKIGRDKQSHTQLAYQKQVEQSGGIYFIAKDFNSFYEWYSENFGGQSNDL